MPTTRRRHAITETDPVTHALSVAAARWPEDAERPSRLLTHLIEAGAHSVEDDARAGANIRLDVLRRVTGRYTDLYEPGYLDELRSEWSE